MSANLAEKYQEVRWICIYTEPNRERVASEELRKLCLDVYLPVIPADRRQKPKLRNRKYGNMVPAYPRYTFCKIELGETDLSQLKRAPGVSRIVQFGSEPNRVSEDEIERRRSGRIWAKHSYERGDRVRMVKAQWAGYEGIIVTFKRGKIGKERARLLLDDLQHPIWTNAQDFEPVA